MASLFFSKWPGRHLGFNQTRSSDVQPCDPENLTLEPNPKWIRWRCRVMASWNFPKCEVGRQYSYFLC